MDRDPMAPQERTISLDGEGHNASSASIANYELGGEVARGGLGCIIQAQDRRLQRQVAIKRLLSSTSQAEQRFVREVYITARLQHPAIVPVYEAGYDEQARPFYAMKLIVGGRMLGELFAERPTLDARLALLPNLTAVAEAIAFAHSQRIIHRDIKPANVLIGPFGETVVIDWGLAKELDEPELPAGAARLPVGREVTADGVVLGTPAYMAPEQARGEPVDERADVYALGALIYATLAGGPPYEGDPAAILMQLAAGPPPPVGERVAGVPPELARLVDKAMQRDPALRYPSARELVEDLKTYQTAQLLLDGASRQRLHDRLARTLVRTESSPAKAVDKQQFERAAQVYRMFLELEGDVKVALAEALEDAGRGREAAEVYLATSIGRVGAEALDLRRRAADQLMRVGHIDEGFEVLDSILRRFGLRAPRPTTRVPASFLLRRLWLRLRGLGFTERPGHHLSDEIVLIETLWSLSCGLAAVDTLRGLEVHTRFVGLALRSGQPTAIARALVIEASYLACGGTRTARRALRVMGMAQELSRRLDDPYVRVLCQMCNTICLFLQGRWAEALEQGAEAERLMRRGSHCEWELENARFFHLFSAYYLGRFRLVSEHTSRLEAEARAKGNLRALTNLCTAFAPVACLAEGRPEAAARAASDAIAAWTATQGFNVQHYNAWLAAVQAALYRGALDEAQRLLDGSWARYRAAPARHIQQMRVRATHLRGAIAIAGGAGAAALDAARSAGRALERERCPWALGHARQLQAALAQRAGEPERARALLADAAEIFACAQMKGFAAAARLHSAALGGPDAASLGAAATAALAEEGVREPVRFAFSLAPWPGALPGATVDG